ncbi:MAG: carboxypeptidase-like regulatory domain-containing protein [Planctomycetaceae bacterium]|jgi:hypothetical protein|nr:carboxypeptidase-like regulatory domain-containing protein [Planctomycetaceae bacterium]
MKKLILLIFTAFLFMSVCGCSDKIKISGNVTFTDGEPVGFGSVVFESPKESFSGRLDPNGHYTIGVNNDSKGVPAGTYKVWLSGTTLLEEIPQKGNSEVFDTQTTVRVASKYTNPNSTDLTVEAVHNGNKTFDFTVERPTSTANFKK